MQRLALLGTAVLLACAGYASAQSRNFDIYWIDVEGGAATWLVAPSGESLLYDAGYGPSNAVGDRDAKRILAAAQQAGLKTIDDFVLSHYHAGHFGVPALVGMTPIGRFFDHGDLVEEVDRERLEVSAAVTSLTTPGVADIWQGHLSLADPDPARNTSRDQIAKASSFIGVLL